MLIFTELLRTPFNLDILKFGYNLLFKRIDKDYNFH